MSVSELDRFTETPEGMRLFQQERAILEVTELICELMDENGVSKSELAKKLGRTKGYITQLLDGRANMTIRTISDVFVALDSAVRFQYGPLRVNVRPHLDRDMELPARWDCRVFPWYPGGVQTEQEPCLQIAS